MDDLNLLEVERHVDKSNGEFRRFLRQTLTAIICATIVNVGTSIWWASAINQRVYSLEQANVEIKSAINETRADIKSILRGRNGPRG